MSTPLKRVLVLMVGWSFVLLGIAGLFLPILQGVLFILIGLFILSSEYVWAHHLLERLRARYPRLSALAHQAKERAQQWMAKIGRRDSESG
ncbi:MAG: PGPGW domain-containing protein [Terriglobales bacterium]